MIPSLRWGKIRIPPSHRRTILGRWMLVWLRIDQPVGIHGVVPFPWISGRSLW